MKKLRRYAKILDTIRAIKNKKKESNYEIKINWQNLASGRVGTSDFAS
jgi:hypothetical protein